MQSRCLIVRFSCWWVESPWNLPIALQMPLKTAKKTHNSHGISHENPHGNHLRPQSLCLRHLRKPWPEWPDQRRQGCGVGFTVNNGDFMRLHGIDWGFHGISPISIPWCWTLPKTAANRELGYNGQKRLFFLVMCCTDVSTLASPARLSPNSGYFQWMLFFQNHGWFFLAAFHVSSLARLGPSSCSRCHEGGGYDVSRAFQGLHNGEPHDGKPAVQTGKLKGPRLTANDHHSKWQNQCSNVVISMIQYDTSWYLKFLAGS